MIRSAVSFLLGSLLLGSAALRPNIIVFLVDDYDKPEISVYGGSIWLLATTGTCAGGLGSNPALVISEIHTASGQLEHRWTME